MKATVVVELKPSVLDPQGKAIQHSLSSLGFAGVEDVRVEKPSGRAEERVRVPAEHPHVQPRIGRQEPARASVEAVDVEDVIGAVTRERPEHPDGRDREQTEDGDDRPPPLRARDQSSESAPPPAARRAGRSRSPCAYSPW